MAGINILANGWNKLNVSNKGGEQSQEMLTFLFKAAVAIGVTHIVAKAIASWQMISHITLGIVATAARARIAALLINTGSIRWAV